MTTPDRLLHVIFGATGAEGTAVVAELMRRDEWVRAVSRRGQAPHGAEGVAADAAGPARLPLRRPGGVRLSLREPSLHQMARAGPR
jgi:uncharacterized protein YbjT (DUF2867 family)